MELNHLTCVTADLQSGALPFGQLPNLVPLAGLEPARLNEPRDFKSLMSTNSTIGAISIALFQ